MQIRKLDSYSHEIRELCKSLEGVPLKRMKEIIRNFQDEKPPLWVSLFNQIRIQRTYSKKRFLEKIGNPSSREFRLAESNLLGKIRWALSGDPLPSPRSRVANFLEAAEEFYLRGFPQLANREVQQANRICIEYEMLEERTPVLEWALKIHMDKESWSDVEKTLAEISTLMEQIKELNQYKIWLFDYWQSEVSYRTQPEYAGKVFSPHGKALSIRADLHRLLLSGTRFFADPAEESLPFLDRAMEKLKEYPLIQLSNPNLSIEIFRRWFQTSLENSEESILQSRLEEIEVIRFLSPSQNLRLTELCLLWKLEIGLRFGNPEEKAMEVESVLAGIRRNAWTRRHHEMAIALSRFYLAQGSGKKALQMVNQLLDSARHSFIGRKYLLDAKELEIEVHKHLGNHELAATKLFNLKRVKK